jgi:hypothetical protein
MKKAIKHPKAEKRFKRKYECDQEEKFCGKKRIKVKKPNNWENLVEGFNDKNFRLSA